MREPPIVIFADGAAKGNPGPGGWGVIVVLPEGEVLELAGREPHTTNNRMELTAAIEALRQVRHRPERVALHTDSTYVIRGIRDWIASWRRRGWKTATGSDVVNRDLWEALAALVAERGEAGAVEWHFVRGHSGVPGNERVDEIAEGNAGGRPPALYRGSLLRYPVPVMDIPEDTRVPVRAPGAPSRRRNVPAHSYLSLVDGRVARHRTWEECERRVKGRSGARYRKATSPEEEQAILRAWGVADEPS